MRRLPERARVAPFPGAGAARPRLRKTIRPGLRARLFGLFVMVAVIPLTVVGVGVTRSVARDLRADNRAELGALADHEAARVEAVVDTKVALVAPLAERAPIARSLSLVDHTPDPSASARLQRALGLAAESLPGVGVILAYDGAGDVVASSDGSRLGEPFAGPPELFAAPEPIADVRADRARPTFVVQVPVESSGRRVGLLYATFDVTELSGPARGADSLGDSVETTLSKPDAGGGVFIVPLRFDPDAALRTRVPAGSVADAALAGRVDVVEGIDYRHREVVAAVRRIPSTGWGLAVKVDRAEAEAPIRRLVQLVNAAGVVALLLVAAGAYVASRSGTRRLRELTATAQAISGGDLSRRVPVRAADEIGELAGAFNSMADELTEANARLAHEAEHDYLTGLPNRAQLMGAIGAATARCRRRGAGIAVVFLDLDGFKQVNDRIGHRAGDVVLIDVAHRLRNAVRAGDVVARYGGDEFVLCYEDVESFGAALQLTDRLVAAITAPIQLEGGVAQVGASFGIAFERPAVSAPEALVHRADAAMYANRARLRRLERVDLVPDLGELDLGEPEVGSIALDALDDLDAR